MGGHMLCLKDDKLHCRICRATSTRDSFVREKCPWSTATQWARLDARHAGLGLAHGPGHDFRLSGTLLWCNTCGAYADSRSKGISKPCAGKPEASNGGRAQQLAALRARRHPKSTRKQHIQLPPPIARSVISSVTSAEHAIQQSEQVAALVTQKRAQASRRRERLSVDQRASTLSQQLATMRDAAGKRAPDAWEEVHPKRGRTRVRGKRFNQAVADITTAEGHMQSGVAEMVKRVRRDGGSQSATSVLGTSLATVSRATGHDTLPDLSPDMAPDATPCARQNKACSG